MLKLSPDIPYQEPIFFTNFIFNNEKYNVLFYRGYGDTINGEFVPSLSHYFIQIYKEKQENETPIQCAYIYFYLNFETRETKYIGTYVKPEFRNNDFASLLTSLWTYICMDNNFYEYVTNKKQRKPFLLYLLKLYGFEISDLSLYDTSNKTVFICKDGLSKDKCIYFKDGNLAKNFSESNNAKKDNYRILSSLDNVEVLDKILISTPYELQNYEKAYTRSRKKLENKGII